MGNAGMTILINPTPDELQNWYATAKVGEVCQVIAKDNKRNDGQSRKEDILCQQ